jgi:hypothetical protein
VQAYTTDGGQSDAAAEVQAVIAGGQPHAAAATSQFTVVPDADGVEGPVLRWSAVAGRGPTTCAWARPPAGRTP